jgi:hypothetical protein
LKIGDCSIEILIKFILLIDAAAAGDNDDDWGQWCRCSVN